MFQAFSISDVVTDVLIIAIPIYWVRRPRVLGFGGVLIGVSRYTLFVFRLGSDLRYWVCSCWDSCKCFMLPQKYSHTDAAKRNSSRNNPSCILHQAVEK